MMAAPNPRDMEPIPSRDTAARWENESEEGAQTTWKYRYRMAMSWLRLAEEALDER